MFDRPILIAGPTASGKSALALRLAGEHDAVIVNADSMQVYEVLDVLTARPSPADRQQAPHHLYGHVPPTHSYSTGQWLRDVEALAQDPGVIGRTVIFVGGTGLYFRALTRGLSPMPPIDPQIRQHWRIRLDSEGVAAMHRLLAERDPPVAAALRPSDPQRILRALEVLDASGRSISWWQAQPGTPLVDAGAAERMVLLPPRPWLRERVAGRFRAMIEAGAVDEVKRLRALHPSADAPALRAIGVRELSAWLDGEMTRDEAVKAAIAATNAYVKRQMTWFRNQLNPGWRVVGHAGNIP